MTLWPGLSLTRPNGRKAQVVGVGEVEMGRGRSGAVMRACLRSSHRNEIVRPCHFFPCKSCNFMLRGPQSRRVGSEFNPPRPLPPTQETDQRAPTTSPGNPSLEAPLFLLEIWGASSPHLTKRLLWVTWAASS